MGNFGSKDPKTKKKGSLPEPIYSDEGLKKAKNGSACMSMSAKNTPRTGAGKNVEFHKSLSMYELRRRKSRAGGVSITAESLPEHEHDAKNESSPTSYTPIKSAMKQSVKRLGSNGEEKSGSISTSRLPMPLSRTQSIRRPDPHPIIAAHREIIAYCFENSHSDLGHRILMRLFEKRTDFQKFVIVYGKDKWSCLTTRLKDYLEDVVLNLDHVETVERLSKKYGEEHVELKTYGFKPDFWVSLADAITVECVILDQANHQPTDTVAAWSQLVSIMFTSIRDGYYNALRALRINSRKSLRRQATVDPTNNTDSPNAANENTEIVNDDKPPPLVLNTNNNQVTFALTCITPINEIYSPFNKADSPIRLETPIFE